MQKLVIRHKEGYYKGKNPARRYNNYKYICNEHQCPQVHKTNTSELKGTDRIRYNNTGRSQHPILFNRKNIQTKKSTKIP
jgi:hypothetical protein